MYTVYCFGDLQETRTTGKDGEYCFYEAFVLIRGDNIAILGLNHNVGGWVGSLKKSKPHCVFESANEAQGGNGDGEQGKRSGLTTT